MGPGPPRSNIVGRQIALRLVHGCLIADFISSRLGGGGPAARTAHARACTTKHAARHRFAWWCGISGRQRSHRFRCDVLQAVHSQLRRLRRAAAGGQPARRRRCGRAGRGASLLPDAAALGEEVRALSQRGDGEARGALGRAGRGASLLPAAAALGEGRYMHFHSVAMARRAARSWRSWRVWRSGERRGTAVGGVALAPMRLRRARCIIAASSGRARRGGTCTGTRT